MVSSVFWVVIFISILIIIHEFGHLLLAKLAHIPVEVFSVGFGPVIVKAKLGETEYRLSVIPLGGFIKMAGEEEHAGPPPDGAAPAGKGFLDKPLGWRVAVIAAGPVSNLVLGFILLMAMYLAFGEKYVAPVLAPVPGTAAESAGVRTGDLLVAVDGETIPNFARFEAIAADKLGKPVELALRRGGERLTVRYTVPAETSDIDPLLPPVIERVRSGSPAARIGLRPGDMILSVAGKPVTRWDDFVEYISNNPGVKVPITWQRGGRVLADSITPTGERDQMTEQRFGQVGVWVHLPKKNLSVPVAAWEAMRRAGYVTVQTFVILYKVVTRQISTKAIGGPIMVAKIAYEGASWGAEYFLALWALLSINLFVVNLLPIPVLDGGRIALDVFGAVRRRRLSDKEMNWAVNVGWIMIGALVLFTVFNDVLRLIHK